LVDGIGQKGDNCHADNEKTPACPTGQNEAAIADLLDETGGRNLEDIHDRREAEGDGHHRRGRVQVLEEKEHRRAEHNAPRRGIKNIEDVDVMDAGWHRIGPVVMLGGLRSGGVAHSLRVSMGSSKIGTSPHRAKSALRW
jgi:hypothetical protein